MMNSSDKTMSNSNSSFCSHFYPLRAAHLPVNSSGRELAGSTCRHPAATAGAIAGSVIGGSREWFTSALG